MHFFRKLLPLLTAAAFLLCGCGTEKGYIDCQNRLLDYTEMSQAIGKLGVDFNQTRTVGKTLTPDTPLLTPYLIMQQNAIFTCRCILVGIGDGNELHMIYHTANGANYYQERSTATQTRAYIEDRALLMGGVYYHGADLLYQTDETRTIETFERLYDAYTFETSYEVTVGKVALVCEEWSPPGNAAVHKLFFKDGALIADISTMGQQDVYAFYTSFYAVPDTSILH